MCTKDSNITTLPEGTENHRSHFSTDMPRKNTMYTKTNISTQTKIHKMPLKRKRKSQSNKTFTEVILCTGLTQIYLYRPRLAYCAHFHALVYLSLFVWFIPIDLTLGPCSRRSCVGELHALGWSLHTNFSSRSAPS